MSNTSDEQSMTPAADTAAPGKKVREFTIMLGTEGTGQYGRPWIATDWMRLGVRQYAPGRFRVRIEVTLTEIAVLNAFFPRSAGWKQPGDGGQRRYSTTVAGEPALRKEFGDIISPLFLQTIGFDPETDIGPDAPQWFRDLLRAPTETAVETTVNEPAVTTAPKQDLDGLSPAELLAIARAEHVPGANSRWGAEALRRNILAKRAKVAAEQ